MNRYKSLMITVVTLALLVGLLGVLPAPVAHAIDITVTADSLDVLDANGGDCSTMAFGDLPGGNGQTSLREAICVANNTVGLDTITLPAGTYSLTLEGDDENANTTGDLDIRDDLTINGAGAATTTVQGAWTSGNEDRILHILSQGFDFTVIITGVTIRDGYLEDYPAQGGGINNGANLTLQQVTVTNNVAIGVDGGRGYGGGIYNAEKLIVEHSVVSGNLVLGGSGRGVPPLGGNGGGIYNEQAAELSVAYSTISGNTAQGESDDPHPAYGGGIRNWRGTVAVEYSTISGNTAQGGNDTSGAQLGADGHGGGIATGAIGGTVTMTNTTVSGNYALGGSGEVAGDAFGGGIYNDWDEVYLLFCTINDNEAVGDTASGGGIYFDNDNEVAVMALHNTIIADSVGGDCGTQGTDVMDSVDYNLASDDTCDTSLTQTNDQTSTDPDLGPLQDNGGETETHALSLTSPAVDQGDCTLAGVSDDQRNVARPQDGDLNGTADCDIGAYELQVYADMGDAPDPTYPTLWASAGAVHRMQDGLYLGACVDAEADGQPTTGADGDDTNAGSPVYGTCLGNDDEDGVTFATALVRSSTANLDVTASVAGYLNAWIDFNADGDWADSGERVFTDQALAAGTNSLGVWVPLGATVGDTYARFRFTEEAPGLDLGYDGGGGLAGEVEDYQVTIEDPSIGVSKTADPTSVDEPGGTVTFTIEVSNTGPITIELTSLLDDVHGDLNGVGDCSVPQTIPVGGSYQCRFTANINGNGGYMETDTVTANGTGGIDPGVAVSAMGSATVTVNDVQPSISVTKTANPTSLYEPGGTVTFTVQTSNMSSVEAVYLMTLNDDVHGDLNGQGNCTLPQTIAPGGSYQCMFSATVSGNAGDVVTDTVTASAQDDEQNMTQAQDSAAVTILSLFSLGDFVWYDTDQDGIQDAGEPGVQGITVTLYLRVCGQQAMASDVTDANGNYLFVDLSPGIYCLQFSNIPDGWTISPQNQGADDTVDSDADPATAQITNIDLDGVDLDEDMGVYVVGSIGGAVFCDANNNGVFDAGEGVAGVDVSLHDDPGCDEVAVNLLATQDTVGDGQYLFDGLAAGPPGSPMCYVVSVDENDPALGECNNPLGTALFARGLAGISAITEVSRTVSLDANSPDQTRDFGFNQPAPEAASIGDWVWLDANVNGIQEAGESGVSGVTVTLYNCDGTALQSTTTAANGLYGFVNLQPGSYLLGFAPPPNYLFTLQNQGSDPALDSDADPATGRTVCTVLAEGENDMTWDTGLYEPVIEGAPPIVPEASTLLLLGSAASGLAGYVGLQLRARRRRPD